MGQGQGWEGVAGDQRVCGWVGVQLYLGRLLYLGEDLISPWVHKGRTPAGPYKGKFKYVICLFFLS